MSVKIMTLALITLLFSASVMACATPISPGTPTPPTPLKPAEQPTARSSSQSTAADLAWQKVLNSAKQEGKVTAYSYSMVGDVGLAVSRAFSQKYGIAVDIITGRGAEMAERIRTEQVRKDVTADLMDANPTQLLNIKQAGGSVSSSDIPVLQDKLVWQVDPLISDSEGHILVHTFLNYSSFINTKLVPLAEEPTSLAELVQPKWKGKMITLDPTLSSGQYIFFGPLLRLKLIDQETVRAIGRNDVKFAVNSQEAATSLARGSYSLLISTAEIAFAPMMKEGAPIKEIALKEGTVASGNAIAAIKGGPHPNAAKVFLNWLLSQEGQTVFLKAQSLSGPRNEVPDFRPPPAQIKPYRLVVLTAQDEAENARLFREQFLTKLWKE
ncbi:MAG: extracellular solute-binding protein [Dehalococcoidia bacterium]|nr:extracellular solute-binding protein [Dehalococcoidia bacterium]